MRLVLKAGLLVTEVALLIHVLAMAHQQPDAQLMIHVSQVILLSINALLVSQGIKQILQVDVVILIHVQM